MRIALLEGNLTGHRPVYLRNLLDGVPADLRVELHAPAGALTHAAFTGLADSVRARITAVALPALPAGEPRGSLAVLRHHLAKARALRRHLRQHGFASGDVVAIPYVDDIVAGLALSAGRWFGGARVVAVGMRNDLHLRAGSALAGGRQPPGRIHAWLQRRYLANRDLAVHWSNQLPFVEWADAELPGRCRFLGDPAPAPTSDSRAACCAALGLDPSRRHVLCFGGLTPRKGIARLLRLLARPDWPADSVAVLAGRCDDGVRAALAAAPPEVLARVVVRDGFIPIADEPRWFGAADLVWLAYEGHAFMSGCLVSAGLAQRPVAGCGNGLIGWYIDRFALGFAVPEDDAAAVTAVTAHCSGAWQPPAQQPFADHLPERVAARFWDAVRSAGA